MDTVKSFFCAEVSNPLRGYLISLPLSFGEAPSLYSSLMLSLFPLSLFTFPILCFLPISISLFSPHFPPFILHSPFFSFYVLLLEFFHLNNK